MAKTIITIGREYCTGGNYIAEDVANALGIKLYDKELITMAAKHSGLSEEAVAASEKRRTHSLLYSLYTMGNELPLGDQVFILQSRIIKQLAEEGPCVILGRCGDYVLRERKDVLRVFIYAPVEWRRELAKTDPLVKAHDEKGIKEEIEKTDRNHVLADAIRLNLLSERIAPEILFFGKIGSSNCSVNISAHPGTFTQLHPILSGISIQCSILFITSFHIVQ